MHNKHLFPVLTFLTFLFATTPVNAQEYTLIDKNATPETRALLYNLEVLSRNHTLFGHQHATEYGHGWRDDKDRSDVKSVCGSHPAVIGVDISGFSGRSPEAIKKNVANLRENVIDTDEWVDLVGMDNYGDMGRDRYDIETAGRKLKIVSDYAEKAGKLAAFTETGLESIPDTTWWTETLLKSMQLNNSKLAYVMVWRNDVTSPTHYYAPFPGQVSVPNFMEFYTNPYTLFENDLDNIYKK